MSAVVGALRRSAGGTLFRRAGGRVVRPGRLHRVYGGGVGPGGGICEAIDRVAYAGLGGTELRPAGEQCDGSHLLHRR
jgi:hypothetical protein